MLLRFTLATLFCACLPLSAQTRSTGPKHMTAFECIFCYATDGGGVDSAYGPPKTSCEGAYGVCPYPCLADAYT